MTEKLCKDCKHYKQFAGYEDVCTRNGDLKQPVDLVSGRPVHIKEGYCNCGIERCVGPFLTRLLGRCGKEGRFFEKKE